MQDELQKIKMQQLNIWGRRGSQLVIAYKKYHAN